jgi:hypothetical protein
MLLAGDQADQQLILGFRLCTGRTPDEQELTVLKRVHGLHLEHYKAEPAEAEKLLAIGISPRKQDVPVPEYAALTMMANLVLNLDETITKE